MNWIGCFIVCLLNCDKLWSDFCQSTHCYSLGFGCVGERSLLFLVMGMSPTIKCRYIYVPSGIMVSIRVQTWRYKRHTFRFSSVGVSEIIVSIHFIGDFLFVRCKLNCCIDCICKLILYLFKLCTRLMSQTLLMY